jgi:hypothetical protein
MDTSVINKLPLQKERKFKVLLYPMAPLSLPIITMAKLHLEMGIYTENSSNATKIKRSNICVMITQGEYIPYFLQSFV